jgi:hypothetical protein
MSAISQFMENLATLPPSVAFDEAAYQAMVQGLDVQPDVRSALLARDAVGLAERLGVGQTMFCMIMTPGDEAKEEPEDAPAKDDEGDLDEGSADK